MTKIKNLINGKIIEVHPSTTHPNSSYGQPVWVDKNNNDYGQVGLPLLGYDLVFQFIKPMKRYVAIFETNEEIVSEATFLARDLKSAKRMAQVHKRHTPEIVKHKGVRTSVRPYKSHIINLKNQKL